VAKVIFRGPHLRILFGNRKLFEVQDAKLLNAGKTGVWTSGQTQASFDDFRIDRKS
jgi:plasmid rolling circle replication initiator protein Rep